ncbi:DUF3159 domain-containing protein [Luethyella okanaganae]|uniref:DUF3159 domain-containing protein n=1 Tax=Luethyella okanaganae TaxID=69372 RepID=A0ABW1VBD0_9MICO
MSDHDESGAPAGYRASPDGPGLPDANSANPATLAGGMAAAARKAGLGAAADGEPLTGVALLAAMGGVRGIVEAILPGLLFLLAFTFTRNLVVSLIAPVVIGVVLAGLRLAQKQPLTQAVGGLVGIAVCAVLSLLSGKAEDYYVPGFWTNAGYLVALVISVLVGWPLVGLAVGFLMGDGLAWRKDRAKRRAMQLLTLCWAGLFALRLLVQLPLYFAGDVDALGATRLLMGVPLYGILLIVSWLFVRSFYHKLTPQEPGES